MSSSSDEDEIEKARRYAKLVKETAKSGSVLEHAQEGSLVDSLAELDMDTYDDEDDADVKRLMGGGNPGMAFYANPEEDPFLQKADDDSESEDLLLKESDLLIMAARNEEDISNLEVWVHEEATEDSPEGNIYVHHALLLPAFPLCVAWGCCNPLGGHVGGNFAAVGSFEPGIEIWDLDIIDAVEPVATLGGADYELAKIQVEEKTKKKKKKSKNKVPNVPVKPGSHEDAVLGIDWNQEFTNVLASGSGRLVQPRLLAYYFS